MNSTSRDEDAHQQPEDDRADDGGHVPLDADLLHRGGQPAPLGGRFQPHAAANGLGCAAHHAGHDIADDQHHYHGHRVRQPRADLGESRSEAVHERLAERIERLQFGFRHGPVPLLSKRECV